MQVAISLLVFVGSWQCLFGLSAPATAVKAKTPKNVLSLPLKGEHTAQQQEYLQSAFQKVVDSSNFLESKNEQTFCIPLFGPEADVSFRIAASLRDRCHKAVLSAPNLSEDDFGWICTKLYESKEELETVVDTSKLRSVVAQHYNSQPPHPGYDADSAPLAGSVRIDRLFDDPNILQTLDEDGFVVIDSEELPKTTGESHAKLSRYLVETAGQGSETRTDTVHFLDRYQAKHCGVEEVSKHLQYFYWLG
jgi:hypothetical protein